MSWKRWTRASSRLRLHPTVSASEENRSNAQDDHAPSDDEDEEEDEESEEKVEISVSMEMPSTSKETSDDKAKVDSEDESRTSPASSIDEDGSVLRRLKRIGTPLTGTLHQMSQRVWRKTAVLA